MKLKIFRDSATYDSRKSTWKENYDIVYRKHIKNASPCTKYNNRYKRDMEFIYRHKKSMRLPFSGDIIINLFPDDPHKRGKRGLHTEMLKIIENEAAKAKRGQSDYSLDEIRFVREMLESAAKRVERKANVSIMPIHGGLQQLKYGVGRDRFDTYVWCLHEHYDLGQTILFNHCATAYLDELNSFLELFSSAEEYCKCIYNISPKLTKQLIKSGSQPINSFTRVREYLILTNKFWHERIVHFQNLGMDIEENS